jgi:2-hydroxychromene-2-carboxylate isomerase
MAKTIEFLFDFGSPTTFLASRELPRIAERAGADLVWQPVLLGGHFEGRRQYEPYGHSGKGGLDDQGSGAMG